MVQMNKNKKGTIDPVVLERMVFLWISLLESNPQSRTYPRVLLVFFFLNLSIVRSAVNFKINSKMI